MMSVNTPLNRDNEPTQRDCFSQCEASRPTNSFVLSSPHIAPVGLGPSHKQAEYKIQMPFSSTISIVQFVTGPSPIQSLTCGPGQPLDRFPATQAGFSTDFRSHLLSPSPATPGLELPSNHSYGYGLRSSPAPSRTCSSSVSRRRGDREPVERLAWAILVQYAG